MPKYRVLGKTSNNERREAWDIINAKTPEEAIAKAKKQVKSHGKYAPKYIASGWKAVKV